MSACDSDRFSLQLIFEGCCRLDRYDLPSSWNFSISATVITDGSAPLQTRSPMISAPYIVELSPDPKEAEEAKEAFDIQAFHPLDQYKDTLGNFAFARSTCSESLSFLVPFSLFKGFANG